MPKKPLPPIFDDVERVTAPAMKAAELACSNEKACRAWLATTPSEFSIKVAVIVETERGARYRRSVMNILVAALMHRHKLALETRILKHLKV